MRIGIVAIPASPAGGNSLSQLRWQLPPFEGAKISANPKVIKKAEYYIYFAVSNNSKSSKEFAVSSCLPQLEGGGSRSETEGVPHRRSGIQSILKFRRNLPYSFNIYKDLYVLINLMYIWVCVPSKHCTIILFYTKVCVFSNHCTIVLIHRKVSAPSKHCADYICGVSHYGVPSGHALQWFLHPRIID